MRRCTMSRLSILGLVELMIVGHLAFAREKPKAPQFKYVGGTESLPEGCKGILELGSNALTFRCSAGSITVRYSSIRVMQYRPDVRREIRKMKLKWQVKPPYGGGGQNRYFAVVYGEQGTAHAMILEVLPEAMRPYLAEIDLKAGKRVQVKTEEPLE